MKLSRISQVLHTSRKNQSFSSSFSRNYVNETKDWVAGYKNVRANCLPTVRNLRDKIMADVNSPEDKKTLIYGFWLDASKIARTMEMIQGNVKTGYSYMNPNIIENFLDASASLPPRLLILNCHELTEDQKSSINIFYEEVPDIKSIIFRKLENKDYLLQNFDTPGH